MKSFRTVILPFGIAAMAALSAPAKAQAPADVGDSAASARRGADGHPAFSFPDLISPYAGTMTAVYGWYPGRYDYKDGFRMGNYSLLGYIGANISLEFFYSGPRSLLSRMHLNDAYGAPDQGGSPGSPNPGSPSQ